MTSMLRLTFPSRPEYVVLSRLVLSGLARAQAIGPNELGDLKLAVTEASSNSVRHAYDRAGGTVEIVYELGDSHIAIEVWDEGCGFDARASEPEPGALDEGGLGLSIIHAVCDETRLGRASGGTGSWIRFVKRIGGEDA